MRDAAAEGTLPDHRETRSGTVNERRLRKLLKQHREGSVSEREALDALKDLPFEDLGHSRVDHHRELRCGLA